MNYRSGTMIVAAVILALTVAGCAPEPGAEPTVAPTPSVPAATPTPTSEPTKPPIADLVLSTEGLGPLVIGQAPPATDPSLDIAVFDPDFCAAEVDAPEVGMWRANYPFEANSLAPFVPVVRDGIVRYVAVFSPEISTEGGIHIGSSRADVLAAYPGGFSSQLTNSTMSTVYVVAGTAGQLLIEVTSDDASYWGSEETGKVNVLTVIGAGSTPFAVSGGDGYFWGVCVSP